MLYLKENPTHRLFGEFLVPHSLKTYRDNAWNELYIFDVYDEDKNKYLHYNEYSILLKQYSVNYIPPLAIITNPSYDQITNALNKNNFLIKDGPGTGEGIVIKNYDFFNKYGRQTWAKVVTSEFKEKNIKEMGAPKMLGKNIVERQIVDEYVTKALCDKVKSKIKLENNGFTSKQIPQLLHTVFYDVIREDCWSFVKKFKNPTINFKTLQAITYAQVKKHLPDLF